MKVQYFHEEERPQCSAIAAILLQLWLCNPNAIMAAALDSFKNQVWGKPQKSLIFTHAIGCNTAAPTVFQKWQLTVYHQFKKSQKLEQESYMDIF